MDIYLDLQREHSRYQQVLQDLLEEESNYILYIQFDGCIPQAALVEEEDSGIIRVLEI